MEPIKLLIPLDGSALSRQIAPYVRRFFPLETYALHLLHVAQPPLPAEALTYPMVVGGDYAFYTHYGYGGASDSPASRHPIYDHEELASFRQELEGELREEASLFREAGYQVALNVHFGSPAQEIVTVANDTEPDLIAMMTHGRQGLERFFAGSVAEEVVRQLAIPVLLVNAGDDNALNTLDDAKNKER